MNQRELYSAIARATNETIRTIRSMGFQLVCPPQRKRHRHKAKLVHYPETSLQNTHKRAS